MNEGRSGPSGEFLLVIATLVSLQLAQGKTADELVLIAAFFEVLGDNLALIATTRPTESSPADGGAAAGSPLGSPQ